MSQLEVYEFDEFYTDIEFFEVVKDDMLLSSKEEKPSYKRLLRELRLEFFQKHGWRVLKYL